MKKKDLLWLTIAFLAVLAFGFVMTSCRHEKVKQNDEIASSITREDMVYVKACLDAIQAQTFESPKDFMDNAVDERENWRTDSIINCMDIKILNQITEVVYRKYGVITKQLVAKEYNESYNKVYKYIQEDQMSNYIPDTLNTEKDGE